MVFDQGPFLSSALFCEKLLVEQDNVKSAIRIVDVVTMTAEGPDPPKEMAPFVYEGSMLMRFIAGAARGRYELGMTIVNPDSTSRERIARDIEFGDQPEQGLDVVTSLKIRFAMPGTYWFRIDLNGTQITQIPMRVDYVRVVKPPRPPQ
ncbi:MAG: hypothetical protein HYS14_03895 [Candidatus Rokubacteria bacterium]|nr:hypothetical protein [Candidatus Rokubacteria bacterium]